MVPVTFNDINMLPLPLLKIVFWEPGPIGAFITVFAHDSNICDLTHVDRHSWHDTSAGLFDIGTQNNYEVVLTNILSHMSYDLSKELG